MAVYHGGQDRGNNRRLMSISEFVRKRGRPALEPGQPSTDVIVAMPPALYDRVYQAARLERVSVPEVIRRALKRELSDTKYQSS